MKIRFHPAAEAEHLDHVAFYESRRAGLGASYLADFEDALARISEGPHRYPLVGHGQIRRLPLHRFPIMILFRKTADDLQVVAVAHKRRRPGYWILRY